MTGFRNRLLTLIASRDQHDPVWRHNAKLDGRRLAQSLGIRVPDLLDVAPIAQLAQPDRTACLKPNRGCAGAGVHLLAPAPGGYRNLLTGEHHTWAQVVERAERTEGKPNPNPHETVAGPWLLETAVLPDRPPYDWKAFTIGGRVAFIMQMQRQPVDGRLVTTQCGWTPDGERVDVWEKPAYPVDLELPPPRFLRALIDTAEQVAEQIAGPFVRVDMYEDEHGPIFGEITPHPADGRPVYRREWDRKLGAMWPTGNSTTTSTGRKLTMTSNSNAPVTVFTGRKKSEIRKAFRERAHASGEVVGFADPDAEHVRRAVRGLLEVGAIHDVRHSGGIAVAVVGPEPTTEPEPVPEAVQAEADNRTDAERELDEQAAAANAAATKGAEPIPEPEPEPQETTDPPPPPDDLRDALEAKTIAELREHAKLRGINLAGARTKPDIVDAIARGYDA